ncbi:MAG TPA: sensor domain-containing protein [Rhodanobacteraceae bacterium]|nr:sensor domain-containing protein [Rhodanobacteraceae bacterium]
MNSAMPTTIAGYLAQLRAALRGADPALIQDALYDAEEHLRAELAERADGDEAAMLAAVVGSYGAPEEVASIYRSQEVTVQRALRAPPAPPRSTWWGRFFGVAADPRTYTAMFYMLLAMATGIFFFTWAVAGVALSAGLLVLIIGVPFLVLYIGTVRVLSLVEGRIVETLLDVRMPRRPAYSNTALPWRQRIVTMFTDPRTWTTLLYMLLMLPLGVAYFCIVVTGLSVSVGLVVSPLTQAWWDFPVILASDNVAWPVPPWLWPLVCAAGVLLLFVTLHVVRGIGQLHGQLAKHLLVRSAA